MAPSETSRLTDQLGALIGTDRVRPPQGSEVLIANTIVEPAAAEEIAELVRKCEADRITIAPMGAGRTLSELRAQPVQVGVSLTRIARLTAYEPEDMTVTAEAGLTLGELNRHMADRRQRLPIDPAEPNFTTLGALIGAAKAGPLRLSEGTVRDLLIEIRFVGHGGRIARGGAKVVKNVAGYDLMKVMTGSFGTLGIVTEACFKVRPAPEHYALAIGRFERLDEAFAAASALGDLSHVEVLSPAAASVALGRPQGFAVLAGFGGNRAEINYYRDHSLKALGPGAAILTGVQAIGTYEHLRDLRFPGAVLAAQLAVLPAELARCLGACQADFRAHAASGVAQLFAAGKPSAEEVRETVAGWRENAHAARGHLRLLSAAAALRADLDFFDDPSEGGFKLMRRLKESFDPAGIFNPGCFVGRL